MKSARCHLSPLLLAFILCTALPAKESGTEYSHRTWRTQDGLPQTEIRALAQTSDGYLWIGTSGGLVRFDGVRFVTFDRSNTPVFADDGILSLTTVKDGSLWIGTQGGGLMHLSHGEFQTFGTREGLSNLFVRFLYQDRGGSLWVGTDRGFFRFQAGSLTRVDGTPGFPVASVSAMAESPDGTLWLGGPTGVMTAQGGKLSKYPFAPAVRSIASAADGSLWFATSAGIRVLPPGSHSITTAPGDLLSETNARQIYYGRDGSIWVGTIGAGLIRLRNRDTKTYREEDFLPNNSVFALFEDREGSLWVGTEDGLLQLNRTLVTSVTTRNGLAANNVSTTGQGRDGTIWITTVTGGIYRMQGALAVPFQPAPRFGPLPAGNVFEDTRGTLWLGTVSRGIARVQSGAVTFFNRETGLRNDQIRQFLEDARGDLWVASGSGLLRWVDDHFQTYYLEDGLAYGSVRSLAELTHGPHRGDLLAGTDGGLNRIHDRKIVADPVLALLNGEKIWSILQDTDGGIWLGTRGAGLFRLKNDRLTKFGLGDGLLSNFIYQILDDGNGRLWMSSPSGVFTAKRADLDAVAQGRAGPVSMVPYGTADGLESVEMKGGLQPAGFRAATGELWFPSVKGAVRIDPSQLRISQAPQVIVESISADETPVPLGPGARIPAGRAKLQIDYTACNLRSPERLTFKYKLEGFDQAWTPASKRRVAYYTNLPPRDYQFRVIAMDATSEQSPSEASIRFRWEPHFYQTLWFRLLCAGATALALWAVFRFYALQTKGRYTLLLAERTRLAREMHDTVIQGCVGVSTLLEAAGSMEDSREPQARSLVEQARTQIRLTIEEARQAVWDLRHASLHEGLADNLADFARQLSLENKVEVEFRLAGASTKIEQEADRNLLLIAREALRNAVAHGRPSHIAVVLSFDPAAVRLEITDDGSGFEPARARGPENGHYGILGMRERVEQLGGSFLLQSTPGQGAKVSVTVPHRHD